MTIGKFAQSLILNDSTMSNNDILMKVKEKFPTAKTTYACIAWYKSDLRKKGLIAKRYEEVTTVTEVDDKQMTLDI